jgi:hypothetical protein
MSTTLNKLNSSLVCVGCRHLYRSASLVHAHMVAVYVYFYVVCVCMSAHMLAACMFLYRTWSCIHVHIHTHEYTCMHTIHAAQPMLHLDHVMYLFMHTYTRCLFIHTRAYIQYRSRNLCFTLTMFCISSYIHTHGICSCIHTHGICSYIHVHTYNTDRATYASPWRCHVSLHTYIHTVSVHKYIHTVSVHTYIHTVSVHTYTCIHTIQIAQPMLQPDDGSSKFSGYTSVMVGGLLVGILSAITTVCRHVSCICIP